MSFIELEKQDHLQAAIKSHKRTLLEADWHEASLKGPKPEVAPPYEIDESSFYSTDDFLARYENGDDCLTPADVEFIYMHFAGEHFVTKDNVDLFAQANKRAAELHAFFADVENVNSDPSQLSEREHELQVTQSEWQSHRAEREAASRSF